MTKRIPVERYYAMLKKIENSEKSFDKSAQGALIGVIRKLNVSDLNRQCRLRGARK